VRKNAGLGCQLKGERGATPAWLRLAWPKKIKEGKASGLGHWAYSHGGEGRRPSGPKGRKEGERKRKSFSFSFLNFSNVFSNGFLILFSFDQNHTI
jgi:hypothetical protein